MSLSFKILSQCFRVVSLDGSFGSDLILTKFWTYFRLGTYTLCFRGYKEQSKITFNNKSIVMFLTFAGQSFNV